MQIGLLEGYNYKYVVDNTKAAAQIFQLLPDALGYAFEDDMEQKIQMRKLVPLDTEASMGFITTLCVLTFPKNMVDTLRAYIRAPNSPIYNNPSTLVYNFTTQINSAIDITYHPSSGDSSSGDSRGSSGSGGSNRDGSPFISNTNDNPDTSDPPKTSAQQGTTAAIVGGSVFVAAAYGAVMFIIARRYKKKKQSHRRASSISNTSSEMRQQTPSPALMGGALLSRDFTSYGGVQASSAAGGRDSHGSGRSGMNNSARTQYISAPVAAENSLGWN